MLALQMADLFWKGLEVLLKSGKYVVDAKSILGIFSLDLSKPLTVEIFSDDCADLLKELKKFAV